MSEAQLLARLVKLVVKNRRTIDYLKYQERR